MNKSQTFLKGALILSIAGAISKFLGAFYRIPLARMIGDVGMGLYQMAYPIYTVVLALATAGVPVALSYIIARNETEGRSGDTKRIFRIALVVLFLFGLVLTALVMLLASFLSKHVLFDHRSYYPIIAIAPAIFFSCLLAVFRGFFQGFQKMMPTAVSQVIEQIFRITAILVLAAMLFPYGLEYAVSGATFGAAVGGFFSLLFLIGFYFYFKSNLHVDNPLLITSGKSYQELSKEFIRLTIPVSLGAVVLPLVQAIDMIIVPGRLIALGLSNATALYGQLTGMAAILIGLPTIFTISIATSLVPAISSAFASKSKDIIRSQINTALRAGMIISFPCAAGLFILAFPICDLLYKVPEAGVALEPLAFSCIILAAFQLSSAGLQGIGRPEIAMLNLGITGIFKIIFNYTLTSIPSLNIKGAAIGTVLAFLIGAGLNLYQLQRLTGVVYEKYRFIKMAALTVVMAGIVHYFYLFLTATKGGASVLKYIPSLFNLEASARMMFVEATIASIGIGGLSYLLLLILFKEGDIHFLRQLRNK